MTVEHDAIAAAPTGGPLAVHLAGLPLANAVLAASGCAGTGRELARFTDLSALGAVVTRSVTLEPRAGGASPRLVESPSGLVNAIGLPGPGVDGFLADELPWLQRAGAVVVVSVWAEHPGDVAKVAQRLRHVDGIAAIEVNLSNPAGTPARDEVSAAAGVVHQVRRNTAAGVPVFAKLGADAGDLVAVARSVIAAGADGLSLINAVRAVAVDAQLCRPALGGVFGGLSGPAIRPIALRAVWEVHDQLPTVPIVAAGGVTTGTDALEMILAGASAVAVGTALLHDPSAGTRITAELAHLIAERRTTVAALRGAAHRWEAHDAG